MYIANDKKRFISVSGIQNSDGWCLFSNPKTITDFLILSVLIESIKNDIYINIRIKYIYLL